MIKNKSIIARSTLSSVVFVLTKSIGNDALSGGVQNIALVALSTLSVVGEALTVVTSLDTDSLVVEEGPSST